MSYFMSQILQKCIRYGLPDFLSEVFRGEIVIVLRNCIFYSLLDPLTFTFN